MKFELRHSYPAPAKIVWEQLFSEPYEQAVRAVSQIEREVLEDTVKGGARVRRMRIHSGRELPAIAQKIVGSSRLSYEMEERYDPSRPYITWSAFAPSLGEKARCMGSYEFIDRPGGCERLVKGDVTVSIPLVGGKIESVIVEEFKGAYERAYAFGLQWVREHT